MTDDIRNARIKRAIRNNPELSQLADDLGKTQEAESGLGGIPVGDPTAPAIFTNAGWRTIAGEDLGDITDPARSVLGRKDALADKPCEAPDVGYLSGYCDGMVEKATGAVE